MRAAGLQAFSPGLPSRGWKSGLPDSNVSGSTEGA